MEAKIQTSTAEHDMQEIQIDPSFDHVWVISSRRPNNVKRIQDIIGPKFGVTWVVRDDKDYYDYLEHEECKLILIGGDLISSRNRAIEDAFSFDKNCIMLEDDLKKIQIAVSKDNKDNLSIPFEAAVKIMITSLSQVGHCLFCGVAPTNNAFFFNPNEPISVNKFVIGSLIIITLGNNLRFDHNLKLKEDYDYTLQNITKFGGAIRCNMILADFEHYSNKGGAVDYRTEELEQETIAYLKKKWNGLIKDHPRRKNEILLNVKTQKS